LKILREEGVWLEITNLVIPEWTDDLTMINRMCNWLKTNGLADAPLHFSRFTPLYKLTHLPITPSPHWRKPVISPLRQGSGTCISAMSLGTLQKTPFAIIVENLSSNARLYHPCLSSEQREV